MHIKLMQEQQPVHMEIHSIIIERPTTLQISAHSWSDAPLQEQSCNCNKNQKAEIYELIDRNKSIPAKNHHASSSPNNTRLSTVFKIDSF